MPRFRSPVVYLLLSILAAVVTMGLKFGGYALTGSVGLFSDAAESVVNLVAALVAFWALRMAARPADEDHAYGHTKVEYFSSGIEGALIVFTALLIGWTAIERFLHPQPIEQSGLGISLAIFSAGINGCVAWILQREGRRFRSITLEADGRHLMTDVWTTTGVVLGVLLVSVTHWLFLDPLIALFVAANIIWTGVRLVRISSLGLLDTVILSADQAIIDAILRRYRQEGIDFHALRTRQAGSRRFISMHVIVPGAWTVQQGHDLCETIEREIRRAVTDSTVFTHLEPREDPTSWQDVHLDRVDDQANLPFV